MSDYSQITFFTPKDSLSTGNPNKIIYGSDVDAEFSAISTAIATKADVDGDAIGAGTPATEINVDNLKLDANKIVSTNTDGDIELEPNGTGTVVITNVDVAAGEIDGTAIGANSASTGAFTTLTASGDVNFDSGTFFVDASTNAVGIGTSSPASLLTIQAAAPTFEIDSTTSSDTATFQFTTSGTVDSKITHVANTGTLTIDSGRDASWGGEIAFVTDTVERMRIDSAGQVGIGVTNPSAPLDVHGSAALVANINGTDANGGYVRFQNSGTSIGDIGAGAQVLSGGAAGDFGITSRSGNLVFGTGTTERARIDSSGNVGIGTTNPGEKLAVHGNSGNIVGVFETSTGNTNRLWLGATSTESYIDATAGVGATNMVFKVASTERARIDSSGNLTVAGGNTTFNGSGFFKHVGTYSRTTASAANLFIFTDGQFYRSTSSARYKNSIEDAPYGLSDVMALRPVTYKGNNDGDTVYGGLVAEEVHDAGLSEFVQYDEEGRPDALAYGNMVSLCIKAIQEQQEIINDLRARVAQLEGV